MYGLCAAPNRHGSRAIPEAVANIGPLPGAVREREIPNQLAGLESALVDLGNVIAQLRERLTPVLPPDAPDGGCGGDEPRPAFCAVAERLYAFQGNVRAQQDILIALLANVQV